MLFTMSGMHCAFYIVPLESYSLLLIIQYGFSIENIYGFCLGLSNIALLSLITTSISSVQH